MSTRYGISVHSIFTFTSNFFCFQCKWFFQNVHFTSEGTEDSHKEWQSLLPIDTTICLVHKSKEYPNKYTSACNWYWYS